jgi:hypothetical protein
MYDKRLERRAGAFDDRFMALDKIQYVHAAASNPTRIVAALPGKPVPTGLDELRGVQSGALFAPTRIAPQRLDMRDEIFFPPIPGRDPGR